MHNNRIAVSLNGTTQLYTVYNGSNPYMDFNGSGTLTQRYLTNPNSLSQFYGQVNASGVTQWFLTDKINSVRQVVDASGNVLDAITYDPYGNIHSETNSSNAPRFLFAGSAFDSVTGNDQFDARYYTPSDGRFVSEDPLGFAANDSDLYRYTFNQPVNLGDPSGEIIGIIAVGIGIYLAGALINKYSNWSMQNQSSRWALSMTYARWGKAGGQIMMAGGLTIAAAPGAAWLAGTSPYVGAGMFGFGTGTTAAGVYNTYYADHTGWGAPEYVGAYGSLAAPWAVGGGWYAGYQGGYLPGPLGGYRPPVGAPSTGVMQPQPTSPGKPPLPGSPESTGVPSTGSAPYAPGGGPRPPATMRPSPLDLDGAPFPADIPPPGSTWCQGCGPTTYPNGTPWDGYWLPPAQWAAQYPGTPYYEGWAPGPQGVPGSPWWPPQ